MEDFAMLWKGAMRERMLFDLAVRALNEIKVNDGNCPLFPDHQGKPVSKIHLVTSWSNNLDNDMSGHSARRSGAMKYARDGLSVHSIQFLGRWKSSAVFRYIEEAMTELPMNAGAVPKNSYHGEEGKAKAKQKALRPKAAAVPDSKDKGNRAHGSPVKPLVNNDETEQVYAMSNSRGKWTQHIVGQAAWGIPLDSWSTICGWNFAKRSVKVELTKEPGRRSMPCKKCFKLKEERDGVRGAREWAHKLKL